MMKVVVMTGATSFLGINLLKELLQREYQVYALVRKESHNIDKLPVHEKLHLVYGSLEELDCIRKYVMCADLFIHFGWDGSGKLGRADEIVQNKNVKYSMNALAVAKTLGCNTFLFSGSQAEYGPQDKRIFEDTKCRPLSEYGKAKLNFSKLAEDYCKKNNIAFLHLRIFSIYGYGDRPETLVNRCVRELNAGGNVELGPCVQKWNYLYILDFVAIVLGLLEKKAKTGIYNIASKDTRILKEYVVDIYNLSNQTGKYYFGESVSSPEGTPALNPSIDKLFETIGEFCFTDFKEGIKEMMNQVALEERV